MRLLIVDDCPSAKHRLSILLSALGICYDSVSTFDEGLRYTREHPYAGAIFDVDLADPTGRTGIDLLSQVRSLEYTYPIIILTHDVNCDTELAAYAAGATDYIIKWPCASKLSARMTQVFRLFR